MGKYNHYDLFRIKNLDNSIKDTDDNKIITVTFEDNGLFNDSNGKQGTYELFISDMKIMYKHSISGELFRWKEY